MNRLVDYYAILNVSVTASPETIRRALDAAAARLAEGAGYDSAAGRDERQRLLSRARTVLCDEQNRMMYDILGKDVTADEIAAEEHGAVAPPPVPPVLHASLGQRAVPAAPAGERPKTQRELDAEAAYERLCAELDRKAERLRMAEEERGGAFRRTRMGRARAMGAFGFLIAVVFTCVFFASSFLR